MIEIARSVGLVIAAPYTLWVFYLAVMSLKRAKEAGVLSPAAMLLAVPALTAALVVDVLVNLVLVTMLMLERPRELTVSARMARHLREGDGWRARVAAWVCINLLDAFDPSGPHCGCEKGQ